FVFFSSRRRHTRSKRDWSSDVCSSDLLTFKSGSMIDDRLDKMVKMNETPYPSRVTAALIQLIASRDYQRQYEGAEPKSASAFWRSEERRVGEEWGARWRQEK